MMTWVCLGGSVLVVATAVLGFLLGRRQTRVVESLRVEDDGISRQLTDEEKLAVTLRLLYARSRWFWYIVTGGVLLVLGAAVLVKYVLLSGPG